MKKAALDALARQKAIDHEKTMRGKAAEKRLAERREAHKRLSKINAEQLQVKQRLKDISGMTEMRACRMSEAHWDRLQYLGVKHGLNNSEMLRKLIEDAKI